MRLLRLELLGVPDALHGAGELEDLGSDVQQLQTRILVLPRPGLLIRFELQVPDTLGIERYVFSEIWTSDGANSAI